MITGFNTDIKHGDRVFHVQTEDRGAGNPIVESLVYVGGQILLSKRSPYADLVTDGKVDEPAVRQLMDLQHRRIIEAIRRGRFDGAAAGTPETGPARAESALSPAAAAAAAAILAGGPSSGAIPTAPVSRPPASAAMQRPASVAMTRPPTSGIISTTAPSPERSLDQVIIEYLAAEAASERLELNLVKGGELVSGEPVALTVRASTSLTDRPVSGAQITLRIVSSITPTQVLYRGASGADGLVKVTAALPDIGNGNAALIISATSALGTQEIKQLIRRKAV
ncbi:MAG: hypothetical protein ACYDBY_18425 [Thermoanaerobaculia bacterium]